MGFVGAFLRHLVRPAPQHLILHVTRRCNYRCRHCFVDKTKGEEISLGDCRRLAREVGRILWLDIGGGEPFLRDDLPEIVAAFSAQIVMIPTNGSLPERILEQLGRMRAMTRAQIGISLSVDGLRESHDRIRDKPGSWDTVWSTYERLRRVEGISVKINTVITNENWQEIPELMDVVWEKKPDFHSLILLRDTPSDSALRLPTLPELRGLVPGILRGQARYDYGRNPLAAGLLRNYHRRLWEVSLGTLERQTQVVPCLAGQVHLVVASDGAVSPCELLPTVGSIATQPWREILQGAALARSRRSIARKECHCTHNCALLMSILFNPASIPHLVLPSRTPRSDR